MRIARPVFLAAGGVLALSAIFSFKADAGEGQWLPEQIASLDFEKFRGQGLELSPDDIWNGEEGLLSAAVHINGCSASFVSDQGLIVTNHHCGFAAINSASTVESNLLEDGFIADSLGDEIPAPGYKVSFVTRYEDVTAQIEQASSDAGNDPAAQYRAVQKMRRQLEVEAKGDDTSAIVVPYFGGRYWRRIWQTEFNDVRLVYAPPRSVGEYGGETDNWMWPRHTGDFAFFRAYASKDGKPADYSADNVPYQPKHFLKVSPDGVSAGDFVMIMGYPGRTNRYLSSLAVAAKESYYYPMRRALYGTIIDAYQDYAAQSPENHLRVQSTIKSYSNGYKNAAGMVDGLSRNKTVQLKFEQEVAFRDWVAGDELRQLKYGNVLDELLNLDLQEIDRQEHDLVLDQLRGLLRRFPSSYPMVDVETYDLLVQWAAHLPLDQRIEGFDQWYTQDDSSIDNFETIAEYLQEEAAAQREFREMISGKRLKIGAQWIAAQEEWRGKRFYSDANSTLRVSMATIKPYSPQDGVTHTPHTTVAGMMAKHKGDEEFTVPLAIRNAVLENPELAQTNICFLADGDTTGGNSGSPVVDGKGRLVGLNFDRVYENVSGDFGWNAQRSRNISVDIQYVLWLMRDVWPAPRLMREMQLD
ncbi:MAG: hypothetical protein ACI84O_000988 [Myxococcota bacterium]|jgi:hypothetical protein